MGSPHEKANPPAGRRLAERMAEYAALFAAGLGAAAAVAVLVVLFSSAGLFTSFGNTLIVLGGAMLLTGGIGGGGYSHLSAEAIDTVLGRTRRRGDAESASGQEPDPPPERHQPPPSSITERRGPPTTGTQRGRHGPNPRAFWQVMAGFAYMAIGAVFILWIA